MANNTNFNRNTNNTNYNSFNKTTFQADIKRKQALFNRFRRRFNTTTDIQERRFLKTEATRIAQELQVWSKRWQNFGFGNYNWITRNFTTANFTGGNTTTTRKNTTTRATNRTTNNNNFTTNRTTRTRGTSRTRATTRANYCAW